MTSRTRHLLMMAAMVVVVIPFATIEARPWQIAVIAFLGGMVFGEHSFAWLQEERERRRQGGVDPTQQWILIKDPRTRLMLSSVFLAVMWPIALFVLWDDGMFIPGTTPGVAGTVVLIISGAIAGLLWHRWFGKWFRDFYGFDRDYRRMPNA